MISLAKAAEPSPRLHRFRKAFGLECARVALSETIADPEAGEEFGAKLAAFARSLRTAPRRLASGAARGAPQNSEIRGNKLRPPGVSSVRRFADGRKDMTAWNEDGGLDRRQTLKCMIWAGTGVVWTVAGGVPQSRVIGSAKAGEGGFSFVQLSDSHIGFSKPANPDARKTFDVAIDRVLAAPVSPAFIVHTGDVTHSAKPAEFDDALEMIKRGKLDVHYAPGEHDITDAKTRDVWLERFGRGAGGGWYAFDFNGVHFVSLNNVVDLKTNGLGSLGADQLAWLADDLGGKSASTPIVVFCHIPLWMVAPEWGWGTADSAQALALLARFGSVTVLNGHIHQLMQKVEGNVIFHTARSTAFPQPAPGTAPAPGPKLVPAGELRKWLGVREVAYASKETSLAVTDSDLA